MAISNPSGNYIDKITLPTGTAYTIVDAAARSAIDNMSKFSQFLGVTTTQLIDNTTTSAVITIAGASVTATTGSIAIYAPANAAAQEFIYDGSKWQFFGDIQASNLGTLAGKDSASGTYTKFKSVNVGSDTVTSTGSYTPSGGVTLSKSAQTFGITTTSTSPSNSANYWIYTPAGGVTVTSNDIGSTSANYLTGVTGRTALTAISTASPTATAPAGGLNYTSVNDHNLSLGYITHTTANTVSKSTSAKALTSVSKPTYYGGFNGTTVYVKPLSVTVATAASFTGTAANVTVKSSTKFVTSVTSTTENATVTVS